MGRMDGKVAMITGAARGQGREFAVTLAREGADIVGLDCPQPSEFFDYPMGTPEELRETVAMVEALDRRMIAVEGDVREQADLDKMVEQGLAEFGQIDVCVAAAGVVNWGDFWTFSEEQWMSVIDVCLNGVWRTVKAVTPHMIEREQGSIILISSLAAVKGAGPQAHYTAAKHGVSGLMRAMLNALGPTYGIRVNSVLPNMIDTPIVTASQQTLDFIAGGEGKGTPEIFYENGKYWSAIKGRGVLQPKETANAVLYLASDESAAVSGLELRLTAGGTTCPALTTSQAPELIPRRDVTRVALPPGDRQTATFVEASLWLIDQEIGGLKGGMDGKLGTITGRPAVRVASSRSRWPVDRADILGFDYPAP